MSRRNEKIDQLERQIDALKVELNSLRDPVPVPPSVPLTRGKCVGMALFSLAMVAFGCLLWDSVMTRPLLDYTSIVFGFLAKLFLLVFMVWAVCGTLIFGFKACFPQPEAGGSP